MKTKIFLMVSILWMISAESGPGKSIHHFSNFLVEEKESSSYEVMDDWNIRKEKNGIKVFTRWIRTAQNVRTRQIKGVVTLSANREQITSLFTDEELAIQWMVFLDELHYYELTANPVEWYAYGRINVLGKVACFDMVTNNHVWPDKQENQTVITMNGISGYMPNQPGVHRITNLYTSWNLISVSPDETNIEFMVYSDMEPVVPVWITDPIVTTMLISTLGQLRGKTREYITARMY